MKYMAETAKSGEVLSEKDPYMLGRQEWLERHGDYIKSANNWRLVGIGGFALAFVALGGLIAVSMQHTVVPYIVEMDKNSEVVRVARADVAGKPNSAQIRASLNTWIEGARGVYGDPVAQRKDLDKTYAMTLPNSQAYQVLVEYHSANDPFVRFRKETVEVSVNSVFPTTDRTWQVEWTESTRDVSGKLVTVKAWQGSFTVKIIPPTTDRQILVNPLGVYVEQFAWTSRI